MRTNPYAFPAVYTSVRNNKSLSVFNAYSLRRAAFDAVYTSAAFIAVKRHGMKFRHCLSSSL